MEAGAVSSVATRQGSAQIDLMPAWGLSKAE